MYHHSFQPQWLHLHCPKGRHRQLTPTLRRTLSRQALRNRIRHQLFLARLRRRPMRFYAAASRPPDLDPSVEWVDLRQHLASPSSPVVH